MPGPPNGKHSPDDSMPPRVALHFRSGTDETGRRGVVLVRTTATVRPLGCRAEVRRSAKLGGVVPAGVGWRNACGGLARSAAESRLGKT